MTVEAYHPDAATFLQLVHEYVDLAVPSNEAKNNGLLTRPVLSQNMMACRWEMPAPEIIDPKEPEAALSHSKLASLLLWKLRSVTILAVAFWKYC